MKCENTHIKHTHFMAFYKIVTMLSETLKCMKKKATQQQHFGVVLCKKEKKMFETVAIEELFVLH